MVSEYTSKNDSAKRSLDVAATVDLQPPQTTTLAHPPAMGSTSPQQADLRLDAQALSTPFLPEEYTSPLAEPENAIYATTLHSNPVENDRNSHKNQQVMGPAANKIGNSGAMAMCAGPREPPWNRNRSKPGQIGLEPVSKGAGAGLDPRFQGRAATPGSVPPPPLAHAPKGPNLAQAKPQTLGHASGKPRKHALQGTQVDIHRNPGGYP